MRVTKKQLEELRPYLIGEEPRENGEWDIKCPLHEDGTRSASVNVLLGDWFCFKGCGGGSVRDLIRLKPLWVPQELSASSHSGASRNGTNQDTLSEARVSGWHSSLMSDDDQIQWLATERGINIHTIENFQIGWVRDRKLFTIPIRDKNDALANVRYYNPNPVEGKRKIWGVTGHNMPRLYPLESLHSDRIIIGGGEWDVLVTIQNGYPAITRTAAEKVWNGEWNELFRGKQVYLAHDADFTGREANTKVMRALMRIADVFTIELPYPVTEKHGKDLTDFWMEHDRSDMEDLLKNAVPARKSETADKKKKDEASDAELVTVLDSFDARAVGQPVRLAVTIKGKREPGYTIPKTVKYECTRDAGIKCTFCPLNATGGEATQIVEPSNPLVLQFLDVANNTMLQALMLDQGIPGGKCPRVTADITDYQAVEVLWARPSLDHSDGSKAESYKNIRITSVGRHDTLANNSVEVVGALHANPRAQTNEFLAWEISRTQTSVDHFEVTSRNVALMERFQTTGRPLKKLRAIAEELSSHVTKIVGRPQMHALMDLTFHSVLAFKFAGQVVGRGWLDTLVIGDTRTGKSEAAEGLVRHYGAGEVVGGESASFAGLVGGLQQLGGKEWAVTWGVIPINHRRLVVIDEASGLSHQEIGAMSDVRASGFAKLTKIQQEVTLAQTRLLWLSNPRDAKMSDYTYGVDAIPPLIGNNEDVARFDMAMAVALGDIPSSIINQPREAGELTYTSEACHALLMWAWTRKPDQIIWAPKAEAAVFAAANDMGSRYTEDPPLVQAANIRIKIARVAIALAARLFSTDDSHERLIVKPEHVEDAVAFMDSLYGMEVFGYAERSKERLGDRTAAEGEEQEIKKYLTQRTGLAKFLRNAAKFRRQDLEEILNVSREDANSTINMLWEARMLRKENADIKVEPTLHKILREMR